MKRLLSLLLILLLLFSLAACGAQNEETPSEDPQEDSTAEDSVEEYPGLSTDPEILTQDVPDPDRVASEAMTRACVDAMFTPDMQVVFDMVHPVLMEFSLQQKQISDAQYRAMIESYNVRMQTAIDEIDAMCGNWQIEVEILDFEDMPTPRLNTMNQSYGEMGIRVDDGIEVHVQLYIVADDLRIPLQKLLFAFIQCEDQWYLETTQTKKID